jgi:hypothetical protein
MNPHALLLGITGKKIFFPKNGKKIYRKMAFLCACMFMCKAKLYRKCTKNATCKNLHTYIKIAYFFKLKNRKFYKIAKIHPQTTKNIVLGKNNVLFDTYMQCIFIYKFWMRLCSQNIRELTFDGWMQFYRVHFLKIKLKPHK